MSVSLPTSRTIPTQEMPTAPKPDEATLDLTGRTLGDFQLLRKIGQGGMGQVYLARQLSLKREVALKILRKELAENATALHRFQAEAEAIARISHPNIVQVFAIGEQDGVRYMALEYVEGRNLRDYLERKGPPELPIALAIMRQVAAALQRANELGLVHRDIKPENILLNRKVEVKVTDFGLSRYFAGEGKPISITQSGMTLGTPLYMSPEQVQGKPVDHRSDLYSFGVTCYHMLAGRPPFNGTNAFDVAVKHVQETPLPLQGQRPDLPPDLCALVHKLMAKPVNDRYASAKDVLRDLAKIQKGQTTGVATDLTTTQPAMPQAPSQLQISLSGTSVGGVSVLPATHTVPLVPAPSRWPWRILALLIVIGLAVGGWFLFTRLNPVAEAPTPTTIAGLPDVRTPPAVSKWEQSLKEKFKNKLPLNEHASNGLKLGLLYLHDRRWDEAAEVFRELESAKLPKPNTDHLLPPNILSKFGQAIVLAQTDKPDKSYEMFRTAAQMLQRPPLPKPDIEKFFFEHPEFGQAIAEALHRNSEASPLPKELDWLRTPSGIIRGPRS